MIEYIKSFYDNEKVSEDMRIFNIVHTVCITGMFIMSFVAAAFVRDLRGVYLSFGVCAMFMLTMIEANRTGKKTACILFMAVVFNCLYMPALFFLFGRLLCIMPLYFLFGIIYSILLIEDVKLASIIGVCESVFYTIILIGGFMNLDAYQEKLSSSEISMRYIATIIATLVVGTCVGAAVRFRYLYYERERIKSEQLKAEAMDAYVAKDMFLINMSHEIRTPMNAIVGTVNLLLDKEVNEHVSDSVYNILNSCNALLSITDELMDLSKSENGDIQLFLSTYDLSEFLMEIINMMTVRLAESNLDFFVEINRNIPRHLYGDAAKLRQVFVNILNNAIKFTPSGKITLRVDYRKLDDNNIELIVDVEDTGDGIRKEEIDTIFDRYTKTEASEKVGRNTDGTGIGLSICSDIVKKMKGTISVQSEYKVGSVFTFKVPQGTSSSETIAYVKNPSDYYVIVFEKNEEYTEQIRRMLLELNIKCDVARTKQDLERLMSVNKYTHVFLANERYKEFEKFLDSRLNSERIVAFLDIDDNVNIKKATALINRPTSIINLTALIKNENNTYVRDILKKGGFICPHVTFLVVDDNQTNLNVASSILKKYGATVLTAVSGKDCLRVLSENDVDMIFLDYMMPEMNGIDTLENIRKLPGSKYSAMPVVALTANVVSGAREMFLEAGFDDFLAKPIAIDKMERIIRKYIPKELIIHRNQDN